MLTRPHRNFENLKTHILVVCQVEYVTTKSPTMSTQPTPTSEDLNGCVCSFQYMTVASGYQLIMRGRDQPRCWRPLLGIMARGEEPRERPALWYEVVSRTKSYYSHSCRFLGAKLLLKSYGLGITINKRNNLTRGKCCLHLQIQLSRLDPLIAGCDILELGIRTGKEAVIYTARADQSKTTVRAQLFVHHSYSSLLHHSSRLHQ